MRNFIFLFLALSFLISCEKGSGEGGTSSIEGNITYFTKWYDAPSMQWDTSFYPKPEKDVYIIYSDNQNDLYDDNVETDWNGNFRFNFLRKGTYIIYTYTDSTSNNIDYDYPIFRTIEIDNNNQTYLVDHFIIED